MKKKALALLSALAVMTMGTLNVHAASPTVNTTETPVASQEATTTIAATSSPEAYLAATSVDGGYGVAAVPATTIESAKVAVQNQLLNNIASIASMLGNNSLASAAANSSRNITANIHSVIDISAGSAVRDGDRYVVTAKIPSIRAGATIAVLHYTGSSWDVIAPDSVGAGSITFKTASLSPFAFVELVDNSAVASPKTGETVPYLIPIVMVGLAGAAVVCGKKSFAA